MKLLFILLLAAFISSQKTEQPVRVLGATHQRWYNEPGRQADTGETYQVKVYINTSHKVEFTYLWIGHKNVPFIIRFINNRIQKQIANGDSLYVVYNKTKGQPEGDFTRHKLPVDYKGAALLEYTVAGTAQYAVIKSFKQLPDLKGL